MRPRRFLGALLVLEVRDVIRFLTRRAPWLIVLLELAALAAMIAWIHWAIYRVPADQFRIDPTPATAFPRTA